MVGISARGGGKGTMKGESKPERAIQAGHSPLRLFPGLQARDKRVRRRNIGDQPHPSDSHSSHLGATHNF